MDFIDLSLEREGVQCALHARCFMDFLLFDPHSNPETTFSPNFSLQDPEMFLFPKIPFGTPFSYASSVVYAPVALTCIDRLLLSFSFRHRTLDTLLGTLKCKTDF